jgi:hypothetical protein
MNILNDKLDTTNELLTARIGLITLAHTIRVLEYLPTERSSKFLSVNSRAFCLLFAGL